MKSDDVAEDGCQAPLQLFLTLETLAAIYVLSKRRPHAEGLLLSTVPSKEL